MTNPITNPYIDFVPGKPGGIRLNVNVSKADVDRIRIVNLEQGFVTYALAGFIKHLALVCIKNDWSLEQSEQLTAYVRSIIDNDKRTDSPQRPNKNDRRRTGRVGSTPESDTHKHAVERGDETETEGNKAA